MLLIRAFSDLSWSRQLHTLPPSVATIGNFDGVHLGHQKIFQQLHQRAVSSKLKTMALFFEPQAREFFEGARAPFRLYTWREKFEKIRSLKLDTAVLLPFNQRISSLKPMEFLHRVFKPLHIQHLSVGDDFRFGAERSGSYADLEEWGSQNQVSVEQIGCIDIDNERVSSTRIRALLTQGQLPEAARLLGSAWHYSGRVISGRKLGRQLGFPTANIRLPANRLPVSGTYAVRVQIQGDAEHHPVDNRMYSGVANAGVRPTFNGVKPLLEVHLLAFEGDLYRRRLRVSFIEKLRAEQKFENVEQLKQQIAHDVTRARGILH